LRVLVFNNCPPTLQGGGAERTFRVFCEALTEKGFDVYALFPEREKFKFQESYKFKFITFKERANISGYTLSVKNIIKIIKEVNPDVIHLLDGLTPTDLFLIIANKLMLKKPLFVDAIALYRNPVFNIMVRLQMPFYNLVEGISVSNPQLKKTIIRWFVKKSKILDCNPLLIDVDDKVLLPKRGQKGAFNYIFIGVLDEAHTYKGLDLLLKAFSNVNSMATEKNIYLTVVGAGNSIKYFRSLAQKGNISNIVFKGFAPSIKQELNNADALILPSKKRGEGFGKVIIEASLQGLPVLVSKYAGGSYLVRHFKIGRIFNPYLHKQAARSIITFAKECRENVYNENIVEFQKWLLSERDNILNLIIDKYLSSNKRV
jgi:glycosyltransferase involved in cell wall biosynthesis